MRVFFVASGALMFSAFLMLAGSGLLFGLLPQRAQIDGFSDGAIGLLGSAYFAGMLAGCFAVPVLIRMVGHIRVYAACAALATAMPLAQAMFPEPVAWIVLRVLTGFSFAAIYAIIESWLNERATNEIRGTVLALYNIINYGAMAFGQQFMRLYDVNGFELFALTAILISIAAVPVALTRTSAPTIPESPQLRPLWLFKISPMAFVGALFVGFANGAFWSMVPITVKTMGLGPAGVADFVSATIIGAVLALFPLGRYSDRVDRRFVMIGASVVAAISGAALMAAPLLGLNSYWILMALAATFGASAMPIYAIAGAQGNDHAKPEQLVELSTGLLLIYTTGAIIGPLAAAFFIGIAGPLALFGWTAGVHAVLAGYALYRIFQRAPAKEQNREPFVATPRTTPLAVELSPLVHDAEEQVSSS
ncbi:MFS transporter [Tepidamorphus sp. 3E244]|uniref:MFS transporter n=1 Tax=Tepidamorphus sp. 3E244 TaxID=3385498 RepID=UPI0038FC47DD